MQNQFHLTLYFFLLMDYIEKYKAKLKTKNRQIIIKCNICIRCDFCDEIIINAGLNMLKVADYYV